MPPFPKLEEETPIRSKDSIFFIHTRGEKIPEVPLRNEGEVPENHWNPLHPLGG